MMVYPHVVCSVEQLQCRLSRPRARLHAAVRADPLTRFALTQQFWLRRCDVDTLVCATFTLGCSVFPFYFQLLTAASLL